MHQVLGVHWFLLLVSFVSVGMTIFNMVNMVLIARNYRRERFEIMSDFFGEEKARDIMGMNDHE